MVIFHGDWDFGAMYFHSKLDRHYSLNISPSRMFIKVCCFYLDSSGASFQWEPAFQASNSMLNSPSQRRIAVGGDCLARTWAAGESWWWLPGRKSQKWILEHVHIWFPAIPIIGKIIGKFSDQNFGPCMTLFDLVWPCMTLYDLVWPCAGETLLAGIGCDLSCWAGQRRRGPVLALDLLGPSAYQALSRIKGTMGTKDLKQI